MRLRLTELIGRLVSWRFGSRGDADGRPRVARAGAEAVGRHRRSVGQLTGRAVAGAARRSDALPPMQPPAGLARNASGPVPRTAATAGQAVPPRPRNYTPGRGGGIGRARIREAPFGAAPLDAATRPQPGAGQATQARRQPWYQVVGATQAARRLTGQVAANQAAARNGTAQAVPARAPATVAAPTAQAPLPFAAPHSPSHPVTADGRRSCGPLEAILWRQWDSATITPPPQAIAAVDRLAEFPRALQEKLAVGLDGIYVGAGGVPDLDDMAALHGMPLPSGKATWDACAGAYGDRKIVVGTRPSPTPDVMCHEVGHALDDLDSPSGKWQSDSAEFRLIYDQCQPYIASDFHRQRGGLGRKEFFADSFAAIASAQRPALVDMLSGNTRIALRVMLYFNKRYGI
ncbi:MAG: hypothetical protein ACRDNW_06760 [Trebonia sp.]